LQELPTPAKQKPSEQFEVPPSIPGADVRPVMVPEKDPNVPFETHRREVQKAYEALPPLPEFPFSPADDQQNRITLAELQSIAYANSPVLSAAAARVEQARGTAIQAGLYPNPEAGYEADTVNTAATAGYQGVFASQTIITADKLEIAQSAACQDVAIAELKLRRVEIDLATAVRQNYFQALIAQERLKFARGLAEMFERSYAAQIELVAAGESPAYEPLQLRVVALKARNAVVQG
jgi:cobalt-zinc-cadmium efflux system outer membrane protein